jgi:hypothetical protein
VSNASLKILLLGELSSMQKNLQCGLEELGHNVTLAAAGDGFKKLTSDIKLSLNIKSPYYEFSRLLLTKFNLPKFTGFDIVHVASPYVYPRIMSLNLALFKFLKANNKIVTLSAAGDDPLSVKISRNFLKYYWVQPHIEVDRRGRNYYMQNPREYENFLEILQTIDGIIPVAHEFNVAYQNFEGRSKIFSPIPLPINTSKYSFSPNKIVSKIHFFHGVTRVGGKGTNIINEVFLRYIKKYPKDIEYFSTGGLSLDKYLKVLKKNHVNVDQIYSYSMGMNALYSGINGSLIFSGAEPESSIIYNGDIPPIYNITPEKNTIELSIESVIDRRKHYEEDAYRIRFFIENHHNSLLVAKKYIDHWSTLFNLKS